MKYNFHSISKERTIKFGFFYVIWLFFHQQIWVTVKILKIGTPKIITIIVLQLEQFDFTVQ